eukprot:484219-Rhodomonas_salina.3
MIRNTFEENSSVNGSVPSQVESVRGFLSFVFHLDAGVRYVLAHVKHASGHVQYAPRSRPGYKARSHPVLCP